MKLRNKKSGIIVEVLAGCIELNVLKDRDEATGYYTSLAGLNEEWEDYKEPKRHWIIDTMNDRVEDFDVPMAFNESIGNYFETKEEAEKAVEKLKAWKRLKDGGCKPIMWRWKQDYPNDACYVEIVLKCQFDSGVHDKELDLLFGGKK